MRPLVTILQLDTNFSRIAGDVGCVDTYIDPPEIMRVPKASVANIVTSDPESVDLEPFYTALAKAKGDIITTSCGFLAPFQDMLQARTQRPFIASSLQRLPNITPDKWRILTFDAPTLTRLLERNGGMHYSNQIIGLPENCHLREVISTDSETLNVAQATAEIADLWAANATPDIQHLLLECTNLPPYKPALRAIMNIPITDILTLIEDTRPGTIRPAFL